MKGTVEQRFWAKVDKDGAGGCWLWTGAPNSRGYGAIRVHGPRVAVHRFAYELLVAPIPAGMQVDHVCRTRACVNPEHLRVVTNAQNSQHLAVTGNARNKSGYRGVSWHKPTRKWVAHVRSNGKLHHIGLYSTAAEAGEAARLKRVELFSHNDLDR